MDLGYSIKSIIELDYSPENIKEILLKGKALGFIYRKIGLNELDHNSGTIISVEDVVIEITEAKRNVGEILIECKGTFFNLYMFNNINQIQLVFNLFRYPWFRKQDGKETTDLDLARYANSMANLIEDYKIIEFIIEKD